MPRFAPLLRAQLRSSPGPASMGGFTLPCRKMVLEYNDSWVSSVGARDFVRSGKLAKVAEQWPSVEMVMLEKPNKHPHLRAFYVNGREKGISLRNLSVSDVTKKAQSLLESSGKKLIHLKNRPVVAGSPESARGMWSAMHVPRR